MLLDDRYPVLETLESRDGVTLYRVEGGLVFYFDVRTPQDKDRFYRYRAAIRRLEELGLLEAQVSAKPGRYYAFFPERPLSGRRPPKEVLAALAPFGFGPEHVAMGEDGVAYLDPWPLSLGAARRGRGGFWSRVAPGLFLLGLGLLANHVREQRHGDTAYFVWNTHINHTNVCVATCDFCAFAATKDEPRAYTMALDDVFKNVSSLSPSVRGDQPRSAR